MRKLIDRILRTGIKLSLLTGVAFTFAACYGPAPYHPEEPDYQRDQQQLEQQLSDAAQPENNR